MGQFPQQEVALQASAAERPYGGVHGSRLGGPEVLQDDGCYRLRPGVRSP